MGGGKSAQRAASRAYYEEQERKNRVSGGTRDIRDMFAKQFDPNYYKTLETNAGKALQPDVDNKYQQSLRELQAALLRGGNLHSTAGQKKIDDAGIAKAKADQAVKDRIAQTIMGRKQDVANAESASIAQLQASADPATASAQAQNLINANTADPAYQPLGQLFTDFTAGLSTQADLERQGQNRYNFGVSNWGNNARRYVQNISG